VIQASRDVSHGLFEIVLEAIRQAGLMHDFMCRLNSAKAKIVTYDGLVFLECRDKATLRDALRAQRSPSALLEATSICPTEDTPATCAKTVSKAKAQQVEVNLLTPATNRNVDGVSQTLRPRGGGGSDIMPLGNSADGNRMADKKAGKPLLRGQSFEKEELQEMCHIFGEKVGGNKGDLITRLEPHMPQATVQRLKEYQSAHLKIAQLRELGNPRNIKAATCFELEVKLAHAGVPVPTPSQTASRPAMANDSRDIAANIPVKLAAHNQAAVGVTAEVDVESFPSLSLAKLKEICKEYKVPGYTPLAKQSTQLELIELMRDFFGGKGHLGAGASAFTAAGNKSAAMSSHKELCNKYIKGACSGGCGDDHPELKSITLSSTFRSAILAAGKHAYDHYYSKPYQPMPPTFEGLDWDYYMDWDPLILSNGTKVHRPNHNLVSAMRKAVLVLAVCDELGWKPSESESIAMAVAVIFEVVGRESEIGFNDDRELFLSYKNTSLAAYQAYGERAAAPWSSAVPDAVEGLRSMYYEPRKPSSLAARMQDVFEIVHELDLFRCWSEDKLMEKIDSIEEHVGSEACHALILRAENQIVATRDRLVYSLMGNRVRDDYDKTIFPRCSRDPEFCLKTLENMPRKPPRAEKATASSAPATTVPAPAPTPSSSMPKAATDEKQKQSGRSLVTSHFLSAYDRATIPQFLHELMAAMFQLISWYAKQLNRMADGTAYFELVQRNAVTAGGDEAFESKKVPFIAVRTWTTAEQMEGGMGGGLELCSILNKVLREDVAEIMDAAAIICRAINMQCVCRNIGKHLKWPVTNKTYRGTTMPREYLLSFYEAAVGQKFRAAQYVATSADDEVAEKFRAHSWASGREPVMFILHLDPAKRCKNVNFIDKTDGSVSEESEYLFAPYSAFKVRSVKVLPHMPSSMLCQYHTVELDVMPDNAKEDPNLQLAMWI